jgi:Tfp pilus assembly major pilin PilA
MQEQTPIKSGKNGFSLAGALVAVVIISSLAAISFFYLKTYQEKLRLSASARQLISDLRYIQQRTVEEQIVYGAEFGVGDDHYELVRYQGATSTLNEVNLSRDVSISEVNGFNSGILKFNYYGAASESGEVKLENVRGQEILILIKPSGYVEIQ